MNRLWRPALRFARSPSERSERERRRSIFGVILVLCLLAVYTIFTQGFIRFQPIQSDKGFGRRSL